MQTKVIAFHGMMTNLRIITIENQSSLRLMFHCEINSIGMILEDYKNALYEFQPRYMKDMTLLFQVRAY